MFLNKSKKLNARILLLVALALVASLVLAACGDPTATAPVATTAAPAATTAAAPKPTTAAGATTAAAGTTTASAATTTAVATSATGAATPPGGYTVKNTVTISGSGSSFINPPTQEWVKAFVGVNTTVKMSYSSVGSGAGRTSFFNGETDFAGTDAYPTQAEVDKYGKAIVTIPVTLGAVVLAYNLPGVTELKFSNEIIGGIYTGKITKWNDPKITAENAGVTLPDSAITLAVRQDSSGTSDVFSKWLASVSPDFNTLAIAGSQPAWEKGGITVVKGPQNDGVAGLVKQTVGGLGYMEAAYADANKISYASVKNSAGNYVKATLEAISAAGAGGAVPDNLQIKVINSADPKAYPIAATSWIIFPKEIASKDKADALLRYVWWITSDAAPLDISKKLGYAPLPAAVVTKLQATLLTVKSGGTPVLK